MSPKNKIELQLSECRSRLREIATMDVDSVTDEVRTESNELRTKVDQLEIQLRSAIASYEEDPVVEQDSESRERNELRSKAKLTNYLLSAVQSRVLDGPEAEYSAAHGAGGSIPVDLFEKPETRAVTSAPGTVGIMMDPILPAVFAPSVAGFLKIDMPMVQSGTFGQSTISSNLSAEALDKGTDASASSAGFTVRTATPKRISARLEFLVEDVASAGVTNFEASLRQNLSMSLSDELDRQLLRGDGTGNNLTGLITALPDAVTDSVELTYAHAIGKIATQIDGRWALELSHIKQLVGPETYRKMLVSLGGDNDLPISIFLKNMSAGLITNSRMPAVDSTKQIGVTCRMNESLMGMRTAVCPHWGTLSISDVYSGSARGETSVEYARIGGGRSGRST